MFKTALLILIIGSSMIGTTIGYTLRFKNNCGFTVWPAVGKAPNGQPDPSVAYGARLDPGGSSQFGVNDREIGIRSWGRTGCDGGGGNCATGACNGGLRCTDGGITSRVLLGEYGYQQFGNVISWDLSRVDGRINSQFLLIHPSTTAATLRPVVRAIAQPIKRLLRQTTSKQSRPAPLVLLSISRSAHDVLQTNRNAVSFKKTHS
ncbi:hypothetical protein MJO28_005781 [Puccinia striiformis f. sp. tritici]|uniref:Uncharacterized protein n=1 Tax=Puccinia striiformis f. sp. tritici TaxID=168172 RepID=A0ACC0ELB2_9BASI|nr:hypothetical protein MJO28_005781 [Puccinia striiformis f. sp. tritici]